MCLTVGKTGIGEFTLDFNEKLPSTVGTIRIGEFTLTQSDFRKKPLIQDLPRKRLLQSLGQ